MSRPVVALKFGPILSNKAAKKGDPTKITLVIAEIVILLGKGCRVERDTGEYTIHTEEENI